jgi:hypothetical protein
MTTGCTIFAISVLKVKGQFKVDRCKFRAVGGWVRAALEVHLGLGIRLPWRCGVALAVHLGLLLVLPWMCKVIITLGYDNHGGAGL